MSNNHLYITAGVLFMLFSIFTVWLLRFEYGRHGRLSWLGVIVHVLVYCVHGMFYGLLVWGPEGIPQVDPLAWIGIPLIILGLGITFYAMDLFRTFSRWLGNRTPGLATNGLYRYSRNPQFVGYGLSLFGILLAWWNNHAWIGLLVYFLLAFAITRVEEEHLLRIYGASYRGYCQRVPRYIGIPRMG